MKRFLIFSLVLLFQFNSGLAKSTKPNIIFIICDQMRGDAFGAYGNKVVNTPNIDKLAEQGVMFTNAYVNNPVCLPSRVSMFSGKYPGATGIYGNYPDAEWLKFEKSLPWYLKEAGYELGYVGKNHAFISDEFSNFDYVSLRGREKCRAYSEFVPPNWHSDIFWPEEDCNPLKNTKDAIQFINGANSEKPFFLTVSYFDPHPPYMAPARVTSKYCAADMELPEYINPAKLSARISKQQKALRYDKQTESDVKETMRYYYAAIEWGVDEQVGKIMEALKQKDIDENTFIVFTSDHGDFMGEFNMVRKAMFLYDALMHVPLIWYAPGQIKEGLKVDDLAQNVDIFPTLLELAGIKIPENIAGKSLKTTLKGEGKEVNKYVFSEATYSKLPDNYWENPEPYYNPNSKSPFHSRVERLTWENDYKTAMIRTKEWKLIGSDGEKPELYFMGDKHIERENLIGNPEYLDIYKELKTEIESYSKIKFIWE